MAKRVSGKRGRRVPGTILRLFDLDVAKSALLNSLSSTDAQHGYRHAIGEFIGWYWVLRNWRLTTFGGPVLGCATRRAANWSRSSSYLDTSQSRRRSDTSAVSSEFDPR